MKRSLKCVVEFWNFGKSKQTTTLFYFDDSVPKFLRKNVTNPIYKIITKFILPRKICKFTNIKQTKFLLCNYILKFEVIFTSFYHFFVSKFWQDISWNKLIYRKSGEWNISIKMLWYKSKSQIKAIRILRILCSSSLEKMYIIIINLTKWLMYFCLLINSW